MENENNVKFSNTSAARPISDEETGKAEGGGRPPKRKPAAIGGKPLELRKGR